MSQSRFCKRDFRHFPFSSVGVEADAEKMAMVVKELKGKNLEEVMAAGTKKLGSMPSGNWANLSRVSAYEWEFKVMSVLQLGSSCGSN